MKEGWETRALGDVCQLISGQHIDAKDYNAEGRGIGYLTGPSDFGSLNPIITKWTEHPKVTANRGDVLLTVKGSGVGKVNLLNKDEVAISRQLMAIRVLRAEPRFVYAFLESTFDYFQSLSTGAAIPGISREQVLSLTIDLPPLAEQQRIVALLDEAFEAFATAKANAEQNLLNSRALFESHLDSVFSQGEEGWTDRQLASLCSEITVGHVGPMKSEYKKEGIPFLRSQNIHSFEVSVDNTMFIDEEFHRSLKKSRLSPGDVAIVRTGYPGTAAVIPPELTEANCSDLVIVRPGDEIDPRFLAAFFNSPYGRELVLGKIVGAAQKHFNITAAKEVMLRTPPIEEQHIIVEKIHALRAETQRLTSLYERKLAALEELKTSLLHQAFNGEL